jgi:lipopolysaccharide/colanic/teichoic acid biosynthesis glycosyltransferase
MIQPDMPAKTQFRFGLKVKRVIDFLGAGAALVVSFPVLVPIGVAVKLTSPGPVFYSWRVVGMGGIPFLSYKLRSMYKDADKRKAELLAKNEMSGPVFKITDDPRVTPLGRFLRKYSLDELPQLWSVVKGDMSLVGPRPPLVTEYEQFTDFQKLKLAVKPGITCLWQVNGRNDVKDFDEWVRLDLEYIYNWSLWLDIKILLKTFAAVFAGTGK